jgi:hypothetical protein
MLTLFPNLMPYDGVVENQFNKGRYRISGVLWSQQ